MDLSEMKYESNIILGNDDESSDNEGSSASPKSDLMPAPDEDIQTELHENEHDDEPPAEKIDFEDIEILDSEESEERRNNMGNEQNIRFKTGEAAKQIGTTEQTVRNYTELLKEFLDVETAPSGHRTYSRKDIEFIRDAIKIKNEKNWTTSQVIDFFRGKGSQVRNIPPDMANSVLISLIYDAVQKAVTEGTQSSQQALLEADKTVEKITELYETSILEKKKSVEEYQELLKKYEEMTSSYEAQISELADLQKETLAKLEELKKKKKTPFWKK